MSKAKSAATVLAGTIAAVAGVIAYVAYRTRQVHTPRRRWARFGRRDAKPLTAGDCKQLEGLYSIEGGNDFFGETAAVKYSYTVEHGRTLHHLSFFCEKSGLYFIGEGKRHKGDVLLRGVWRRAAANGAGLVRLVLRNAVASLDKQNGQAIYLQGFFGYDSRKPDKLFSLRRQQALPANDSVEIIGHRGASRNMDFLPVSENSLAMMKMAAPLGATGVEIDVRMTKDHVPVVFHDRFLSVHTINGPLYNGWLSNYTLAELKKMKLRKGGVAPTLDECLHTILYQTPLRFVWLDIKRQCDLKPVVRLQQLYLQRAKAMGRDLIIYIGIPDGDILKCFTSLENYKDIPSLVEIDPELAIDIHANAWAPQYVSGFQRTNVERMHALGKKAFVWSLDNAYLIDLFMSRGGFDGIVTNAPMVMAHWLYTKRLTAMPAEKIEQG